MIKPLGTRVLLGAMEKDEDKTESGIILPDEVQKESNRAEVIAIGEEVKYIKVGDKVLLQKFNSATSAKDGGKEYLIVDYKEIAATL